MKIINFIKKWVYSKKNKEIFILLADGDGTMKSIDEPWGAAVYTEEEAQRYVDHMQVAKAGIGYTHSYTKVKIFKTYEEARGAIFRSSI